MYTPQRIQRKTRSQSSNTAAETSLFKQRPFTNEDDQDTAQLQDYDETPDVQNQLEQAAHLGHNFGRVKVQDSTPAVIQPKLAIGAPGDKYEQEADSVASQVMSMNAPTSQQSIQRQGEEAEEEEVQMKPLASMITPLVQRQEEAPEEEELQAEPLVQRQEEAPEEEELQAKPLVQRQEEAPEEEELQAEPLVQRQEEAPEEEELQAKPLVQRQEEAPEEEELQAKPLVQRQEEAPEEEQLQAKRSPDGNSHASNNLESQLGASKGSGSPLPDDVRSFMEPRFGVDFSQVRVHTDSQAVQMNQAVGAQAFTHGSDIYFGEGKSPAISDLTAHELTHVVQQTGGVQAFFEDQPNNQQKKKSTDRLNHRVVQAQLNTKSKTTIQRFESNEHKAMGDKATKETVELAPGLKVTFGDLTAIADFFGSVPQIQELAKTDFGVQQIKYVIYVKIRGQKERDEELGTFKEKDDVKNAVGKRYYTLAGSNYTHFTNPKEGDSTRDFKNKVNDAQVEKDEQGNPVIGLDGKPKTVPVNNAGSYRRNHELALKAAYDAGKKGAPKDEAMLYEGFASHFLTDAYAAGHMRPERLAIKEHWDKKVPMFWVNLKWWLAECVAVEMNKQTVAQVATEQLLWEKARAELQNKILSKGIPDLTFGDAISGAVHDYDNEEGVNAQVGNEIVKLVGDGQVIDEKDRAIAAGVDTMAKAVAGVKASLQEVEMAYKGKEPSSIQINGLYRAEQLWPKALKDSDPKQENQQLKWKVDSIEELMADPKIKAAIAKFAKEKADTLGDEVGNMEDPLAAEKQVSVQNALNRLKGNDESICAAFLQIINYTPGSVADLGGVGDRLSDDNAVDYYDEAVKNKALDTLTIKQKKKLIRDVLSGATVGKEELMIVNLLDAKPSDAPAIIKEIGWRWIWDDLSGNDCRNFVQKFGPSFWAQQSYAAKRNEVKFLADGRTNDLAQETMITILRTCSSDEVRKIDDEVGGWTGLSFDLVGKWDDELQTLKAK